VRGWTDAHAHLQDRYLGDPAASADVAATLERALAAGVDRVVVVGCDIVTSREALALAGDLSGAVEIYATVGLHPHDAVHAIEPIVELARSGHPSLVGIGECGLDYYYEHSPRARQRQAFATQISLAKELDLALVIHARDAWEDLWAVMESEGIPERTVIHCFTGGAAEAERCLEIGADISISGVVTFKNAVNVREALAHIPLSRLHVETDSPFLAPVPHRGATNEPAWVSVVGEFVARTLEIDVEVLRRTTVENTARLFRLPA
jgi:TatD DNase family protein